MSESGHAKDVNTGLRSAETCSDLLTIAWGTLWSQAWEGWRDLVLIVHESRGLPSLAFLGDTANSHGGTAGQRAGASDRRDRGRTGWGPLADVR